MRVVEWGTLVYNILSSSVIYYWTEARQLGIYLFYIIRSLKKSFNEDVIYTTVLQEIISDNQAECVHNRAYYIKESGWPLSLLWSITLTLTLTLTLSKETDVSLRETHFITLHGNVPSRTPLDIRIFIFAEEGNSSSRNVQNNIFLASVNFLLFFYQNF